MEFKYQIASFLTLFSLILSYTAPVFTFPIYFSNNNDTAPPRNPDRPGDPGQSDFSPAHLPRPPPMSPRQKEANDYFARFGYIPKSSSAIRVASHDVVRMFQVMAGLDPTGDLNDDTLAMMHLPRCGMPDTALGLEELDEDGSFGSDNNNNSNSNNGDSQQLLSLAGKTPGNWTGNAKGEAEEEEKEKEKAMNGVTTGEGLLDPRRRRRGADKEEVAGRQKRYSTTSRKWGKTDLTYRIDSYTPNLAREVVDQTVERAFAYWAAVSTLSFTPERSGVVDIVILFQVGGSIEIFKICLC